MRFARISSIWLTGCSVFCISFLGADAPQHDEAREIDVEALAFVVHYQLPDKDEYYTHRSGRTARAGMDGLSLALVSTYEMKQIRYFEKALGIVFSQIKQVR